MRASVCVLLAALTLAGCGVRGPLTMPQQPPRPTPPSVPDPGMQSLPGDPATPTPPTR
ncbi:LPS translocon maturation chaperone LptM [Imbroritus primus]